MSDIPEGLYRVTGCRACDESRQMCPEHASECEHENREDDETFDASLCNDCGRFVAPIGPEDDQGRPSWEIL